MKQLKYFLSVILTAVSIFSFTLLANPAIEAYDQENFKLAKNLFEQDKSSAVSKLYLGKMEMMNGNLDEAEELIKDALKMKPNDANYHYWFASISGVQAGNASIFSAPGYASDSKKHYLKAVELDPKNVEAISGLISFYTQAPSFVGGSIEKAKALSVKLTALDKKQGLTAQMNLHRKEDETEKELIIAEQLANAFPNSADALLNVGFSYQAAKQYEKAFNYFVKASQTKASDTDSKDTDSKGTVSKDTDSKGTDSKDTDSKDTDSKDTETAISIKQRKSEEIALMGALYQIGRNAVLSGLQVEKGIEALETYISSELTSGLPSHNWARTRLAALYLKKGNKDKAKALATIASKDDSKDGPKKTAKKLLRKM